MAIDFAMDFAHAAAQRQRRQASVDPFAAQLLAGGVDARLEDRGLGGLGEVQVAEGDAGDRFAGGGAGGLGQAKGRDGGQGQAGDGGDTGDELAHFEVSLWLGAVPCADEYCVFPSIGEVPLHLIHDV